MAFPSSISLSTLDGANGFRIDGIDPAGLSGYSVSGAGDVNGDGIDDFVIGAPGAEPDGGEFVGASYVVFGRRGGFGASFELSSLDGANGFRIDGDDRTSNSGLSVSSAGDVNSDGIDDVLIGAPNADPGGNNSAGKSYVLFGR